MMANDMNELLKRFERRSHMHMIMNHLPKELSRSEWGNIVIEESLVTWSRYFPKKIPFTVNKDTCNKGTYNGKQTWFIKDECLGGLKLLGVEDINWEDTGSDNIGLANDVGLTRYRPQSAGLEDTVNLFTALQLNLDHQSLFNNNIYLDFEYPNKIILTRVGNTDVLLNSFVVNLLVRHTNLSSISPTMMETFEKLAFADLADWLYGELKYVDGLETTFLQLNLLLDRLQQLAESRQEAIEQIENSYVSTANDNIPYIMTVNGI